MGVLRRGWNEKDLFLEGKMLRWNSRTNCFVWLQGMGAECKGKENSRGAGNEVLKNTIMCEVVWFDRMRNNRVREVKIDVAC